MSFDAPEPQKPQKPQDERRDVTPTSPAPFEMPLFPLNVVLFPGMQLPMHIFEPRYRLMVRRVLQGDATFGVALLIEGTEGEPGTVPTSIGCSAEVTEVTPFPDGRMNLLAVGRRRFRILSTREQDGYLVGTCLWLDDADEAEEAELVPLNDVARRVRSLLGTYLASLARNASLSPRDLDALEVPQEPEQLSMWAAAIITLPNAQKQALLEMMSTRARLQAEREFLRRGEIVQKAYARRQAQLQDSPDPDEDPDDGPFARFISLN